MSIQHVVKLRRKVEKSVAKKKINEAKQDIRLAIEYVRENQIHCSVCDKTTESSNAHDFPSACSCKQKHNHDKLAKEMTCLIYNQGCCDIQTAATANEHLEIAILFATKLVPWIGVIASRKTVEQRWKYVNHFLWQKIIYSCLRNALKSPEFGDVSLIAAKMVLRWEMYGENFTLELNLGRTGCFLQKLQRTILHTKSMMSNKNADKFSSRTWRLYQFGVQRCVELMTYHHGNQANMSCSPVEPPSFDDQVSRSPIDFNCEICRAAHIFPGMWKLVRPCICILISLGTHYVNILQTAAAKDDIAMTTIRDIVKIGKETSLLVRTCLQGW